MSDALGSQCLHCGRIGMDSYKPLSIVYGSAKLSRGLGDLDRRFQIRVVMGTSIVADAMHLSMATRPALVCVLSSD